MPRPDPRARAARTAAASGRRSRPGPRPPGERRAGAARRGWPAAASAVAPLGRIAVVARSRRPRRRPRRGRARSRSAWRLRARPRRCSAPRSSRCARRPTRDWVCVISDDCSRPSASRRSGEVARRRPALRRCSRSERRLGFYRNFERALRLAPAEARLRRAVRPGRPLVPGQARGPARGARRRAQLVYCDQRLVDADGRVLRETLWRGRRNNHTDLASLLVANTITGAATLFRREVAELALPFPEHARAASSTTTGSRCVALAAGDVAYVDRPLYDYVQHGGAVFGDVADAARAGARPRGRLSPLARRVLLRLPAARGAGAGAAGRAAPAGSRRPSAARCERFVRGRALARSRSPGSRRGRCARSPAATRRSAARASWCRGSCGAGWSRCAARRRGSDAGLRRERPGRLSFEQRRLRRWRARV